jgi:glycosyltransferase involved in cell wall biosynthesis
VLHIPNAVDSAFATALPPQTPARNAKPPSVLIVNRNFRDEQKGFPIAKAALDAQAPAANERPRLILAGENSDWAASQLLDWECESLGYVSEPAALAALQLRADIFLFASPAENFPCVVLEAMAAGGCVVATPTGGVVEQVEDGVSGLLAKEISGPALAEVLARALSDPPLRARLGESARGRVEREFSENIFVERHRNLYEEVLRSWHSSA